MPKRMIDVADKATGLMAVAARLASAAEALGALEDTLLNTNITLPGIKRQEIKRLRLLCSDLSVDTEDEAQALVDRIGEREDKLKANVRKAHEKAKKEKERRKQEAWL